MNVYLKCHHEQRAIRETMALTTVFYVVFIIVLLTNATAQVSSDSTHSFVLNELSVLEDSASAKARESAVLYLGNGINPAVGQAFLTKNDFSGDGIKSRISTVLSKEESKDVQIALVSLIEALNDPIYIPDLTALCNRTPSELVKLRIILARSTLGDSTVIPYLAAYFHRIGAWDDYHVILGLCKFNTDTTTKLLVESLLRPKHAYSLQIPVDELVKRHALVAVPSLKEVMATKNYSDGLSVFSGLVQLDTNYVKDILSDSTDEFALKVLGFSAAIKKAGRCTIPVLQSMAMDKKTNAAIRINALVALRIGYYNIKNYARRLTGKESEFFARLTATVADQAEDSRVNDECQKIIAIKNSLDK
jgi:hypothetical protein